MTRGRPERLDGLAFFGGGTGGHIFPGIAVAERARERFPGCAVVFWRTGRSVEDRVFGGRDLDVRFVDIQAPGRSPGGWMRYARQVRAAMRAMGSVLGDGLWVGFGLGGYASVPGILAARKARVPVILLEQNRVAGRANRLLAPFVAAIACSYPETVVRLSRRRVLTGNPVRRQVIEASALRERERGEGEGGGDPEGRRTVLVVGGSQGAHGLNVAVRAALPALRELSGKICWIHVAGDADKESMTEAYREHGFEAEVLGYSDRLPALMARSDLVLGRAGGTTLAELAVLGLPSVLVPYPYHRDRHQVLNARSLADRDAARLIDERELDGNRLRDVLGEVLFTPGRLAAMGRNARALGRPDAADSVLDLALDLARP